MKAFLFSTSNSRRQNPALFPRLVLFFGLIFLSNAILSSVHAKPAWAGRPDHAFGNSGRVTAHFTLADSISDLALQSDGKIVAANVALPDDYDFGVTRYNADGTVDASFGNQGGATTDFFGGTDQPFAIAVQPDDKIVVAGSVAANGFQPGVVRYNRNGTLDATFGSGGKLILQAINGQFFSTAIQPDGKILLAGFRSDFNGNTRADFLVVRVLADGSLDNSFGNGGIVSTDFSRSNDVVRDLAIQPDGKIVVVGTNEIDFPTGDFALVRYNSDGTPDASFGSGGKVTTDFFSNIDEAKTVALQIDGKIVVGGLTLISSARNSVLARYNPNGSLDAGFASGGKFTTDVPFAGFFDAVIQPNGKIIAASTYQNDFAVVRVNTNGALDPTFDFDGVARTSFFDSPSVIEAIVLRPDGKLLAGGSTFDPIKSSTGNALALYQLTTANADFDGDNKTDFSVFRPENGTWYISRSRLGFVAQPFGLPTDQPAVGDFEDDGKFDIAVFRRGDWHLLYSTNNTFQTVRFGQAGDIPVSADFDGDGKTDFAVFRNGIWYYRVDRNQQMFAFQFGQAGDVPVPADYDHDGKDDFAVFRSGVWYVQQSRDGFAAVRFGQAGDIPVPADYDGDGRADQAVFRNGIWYLNRSQKGVTGIQFGTPTDVPVNGDFDGDDIADIAVFRGGYWYSLNSANGFSAAQFGNPTDLPVPAFYKP